MRAFAEEASGKTPWGLLMWLNETGDRDLGPLGKANKASRSRVEQLLRTVNELAEAITRIDAKQSEVATIPARYNSLQRMLDDYPRWPLIELEDVGESSVLRIEAGSGGKRPLGEQIAVWDIIGLVNAGNETRIRRCSCGKWYFAKRLTQKACSPRCRHKAYEQTDAFKAKRRSYMRDYYALKQSGKVK